MNIKKIKLKRRFYLLCFILTVLILLLIRYFMPKNYLKEYKIDKYTIYERFDKNYNLYYYTLIDDNNKYESVVQKKYISSKGHINSINKIEENDEVCYILNSNKVVVEPICEKNKQQISIYLVSQNMKDKIAYKAKEYEKKEIENEKVKVKATLNHNYFLYNYKGFYWIKNNEIINIPIFNSDIYNVPLITKVDHYIFIPDYENDYYFQKVYILNTITGKVEIWQLKNNIYLIDKHEKIEWELDINKKKIKKVSNQDEGIIYQDGWVHKTLNKLMYEENEFITSFGIDYQVDNGIYKIINENKILISNKKPSNIIYKNFEEIFYIVDDNLYCYSNYYGEVLLINNFEWNFNYTNMIYVD